MLLFSSGADARQPDISLPLARHPPWRRESIGTPHGLRAPRSASDSWMKKTALAAVFFQALLVSIFRSIMLDADQEHRTLIAGIAGKQ